MAAVLDAGAKLEAFRTTIQKAFGKKLPAAATEALDAWADLTKEAWALSSRLGDEKVELFRKLTRAEKMRDDSMRQFKAQNEQLREAKDAQEKAAKSYRLSVQVNLLGAGAHD